MNEPMGRRFELRCTYGGPHKTAELRSLALIVPYFLPAVTVGTDSGMRGKGPTAAFANAGGGALRGLIFYYIAFVVSALRVDSPRMFPSFVKINVLKSSK